MTRSSPQKVVRKVRVETDDSDVVGLAKDVSNILVCVGLSQAVAHPLGLDASAALAMAVQFVVWAPSAWIQNERFYDFTGMATFILLTARSFALCKGRFFGHDGSWWETIHDAPRYSIAAALVLIWILRLGVFLVLRILRDGHDSRFKGVRNRPIKFLVYFSVQGMWVFLTALPMFALYNLDPRGHDDLGALRGRDAVGLVVWIAGFALEVIADNQKKAFKMDPVNKGRFIDVGLWARCRHPNYVGEMVIWTGFFILCSRGLLAGWGWVVLAGPAFVVSVLTFVSTPMLEEGADRKYGGEAAYHDYKRKVPSLRFRLL